MTTTIRVFPDHQSSGIWKNYCNVSPESIGIDSNAILVALKYWHMTWEFLITEGKLSYSASLEWIEDGRKLVEEMNNKYGNKYQFVYQVSEKDIEKE